MEHQRICTTYALTKFKQTKVVPIYKSGDIADPSNYRPISILSFLSKPLEKHMYKSLYVYLNNNSPIHENQSGFRQNHPCHTALIQLADNPLSNINLNEFTDIRFVDFAKVFDVIDHSLFFGKTGIVSITAHVPKTHVIISLESKAVS